MADCRVCRDRIAGEPCCAQEERFTMRAVKEKYVDMGDFPEE